VKEKKVVINTASSKTLKNMVIAWQRMMARNVWKPKAQAFIIDPKMTMTKISVIKEAKQICKGEMNNCARLLL
jgi:hypothetical protein